MSALHVLSILVGCSTLLWVLASAVRTVVIPRPERVWMTRVTFEVARRSVQMIGRHIGDPHRRDRLLGLFGPAALLILPVLWSLGSMVGFAFIFWGMEFGSVEQSLELSGSSLTTLGFVLADSTAIRLVAISEGLLGLGIVALMISFIPSLYGTFSKREIAVGRLTVRAGEPPTPAEFIIRLDTIGGIETIGDQWNEWENWFVELGETHTSFPALVYFRSARPSRSWLSAAETALDTAAIVVVTGLASNNGQADIMIRSGYLSLRMIADFFDIPPELDPSTIPASYPLTEAGSLSVTRRQFDSLLDELAAAGCDIPTERDQCWRDFHGWRVNYDRAVVGLANLVGDVHSHWSTRPR